jgi:hypothetical protein
MREHFLACSSNTRNLPYMTFEKLHDGLEFDCLDQKGIEEDLTNFYVRGVGHNVVCIHSFNSSFEDGVKLRYPLQGKRGPCQYRCTSISLLANNRVAVKEYFAGLKGISPQIKFRFPYLCTFKLTNSSAKIWETGTAYNPYHRSLMKSDQFCLADLDISAIVRLEDF